MSETDTTNGFSHRDDEIAALLPFYLEGGLAAPDAARVEAWLAQDPRAQRALAAIEDERRTVVVANEEIRPPAGALARLMADIEAEPASARQQLGAVSTGAGNWIAQAWGRLAGAPARVAWAACALLLAVAIGQGVMLAQRGGTDGYVTASGKVHEAPGVSVDVRFAPTATAADISEKLADLDAAIVAGPFGAGVFKVRFASLEGVPAPEQRIATLRQAEGLATYVGKPSGDN